MKLSKKDLQDKRNRDNTVKYTKEMSDMRQYNSCNYFKTASEFHNGSIDANKEMLNYTTEKQNEEYNNMLKDFPPLNDNIIVT